MIPGYMLLWPILLPALAGIAMLNISKLKEQKVLRMYVSVVLLADIVLCALLCLVGGDIEYQISVLGFSFAARMDGIARIFTLLLTGGWVLNGFSSFEQMEKEENEVQYYCFYLVTAGMLNGITFASGYSTLKLFYILMSLSCIPLINHRQTKEAVESSIYYMAYLVIGALLLQIGGSYVMKFMDSKEFVIGGSLNTEALAGHEGMFLFMVALVWLGFGIKACLFPFHGWHRQVSKTAPVPSIGALSGIATKTGILAIIRLITGMIGTQILKGTWVQYLMIVLSILSIFIGSVLAFKTDRLIGRMSYATIGQVGCIVFGISLLDRQAVCGAIILAVAHTMATLVLFLACGEITLKTGKTCVHEMDGVGFELPREMLLFVLAAFVIMGMPPTLGFVGDWNVSLGAIAVEIPVLSTFGEVIFMLGELFAAGYMIGIILRAFFPGERYDRESHTASYASLWILIPSLILIIAVYAMGFAPSPLIVTVNQALYGLVM